MKFFYSFRSLSSECYSSSSSEMNGLPSELLVFLHVARREFLGAVMDSTCPAFSDALLTLVLSCCVFEILWDFFFSFFSCVRVSLGD